MKTLPATLLLVVAASSTCLFLLASSGELKSFGDLADAARESDRLDVLVAEHHRRSEVQLELATALAEGRMSLAEAITRARGLSGGNVYSWMPGESEDERLGLLLITGVRLALARDQGRAREVAGRLRVELREHLGRQPAEWPPVYPAPAP